MNSIKKTLVIGSKDPGQGNDAISIARAIGADYCLIEELLFKIGSGFAELYYRGEDIAKKGYKQVIIFNCDYSRRRHPLYIDVGHSIALILKSAGIDFWNSEILHQRSTSKLSQMILLTQNGFCVPDTIFSFTPELVLSEIKDGLDYVIKDPMAGRGYNNFCLNEKQKIADILDSGCFIVQPFIPNDHDLRLICFGAQPHLLMKRSRSSDETHLNNTSRGGRAEWIDEIPADLVKLGSRIAKLTRCEMAGIDFIEMPSENGVRYCCLEVNSIPQLSSGTDVKFKMAELKRALGS